MNRIQRTAPKLLTAIQKPAVTKTSPQRERAPLTHFEVRAKQLAKKVREQTAGFDLSDLKCAMKGNGRSSNATGAQTWFGANVDVDQVLKTVRGWFR